MKLGHYTLKNVHDPSACAGEPCIIHNPTDHHMRDWPVHVRFDKANLVERICEHGVGHPDPDDLTYQEKMGRAWQGIHGCDGCCSPA